MKRRGALSQISILKQLSNMKQFMIPMTSTLIIIITGIMLIVGYIVYSHIPQRDTQRHQSLEYMSGYSQALYDVVKYVDQDTTLTTEGKLSVINFALDNYPKSSTIK